MLAIGEHACQSARNSRCAVNRARRPLAVGFQQSVEPRDKDPKPRVRLNLARVAKLGRRSRIALRTVFREIRSSRTISLFSIAPQCTYGESRRAT